MDTIVLILILLTAFNFLLKQTFWKPVAVGAATGIAAIFVLLMWPYAIEQSKMQIADWLSNNQLMLDTSVILTIELSLQMAFCLLSVHVANFSPVKRRMMWAYRVLYGFPGLVFRVDPGGVYFPGSIVSSDRLVVCRVRCGRYSPGTLACQMVVAGNGVAFGVVFPDKRFGGDIGNYRYRERANGRGRDNTGGLGSLVGMYRAFRGGCRVGVDCVCNKKKTNF